MNISLNIFDFADIIYIVLIPAVIMVWMTFWLRRQQRSNTMLAAVWGIFTFIVFVGLVCLLLGIQAARMQWLNYFAETAAAYSVVMNKLEHWKIVAGDENLFSDWSSPVAPVSAPATPDASDRSASRHEVAPEYAGGKLDVPKWMSAIRLSPTRVSLRWAPVPGATTYRVQWNKPDGPGKPLDEDGWETVYSGAVCECLIEEADPEHVFRGRAETGTPEDDPTYLALMDVCVEVEKNSRYAAMAYTMRPVPDKDVGIFIVSPATDVNDNGVIDPNERASPIGEEYPNTEEMRYVFHHHAPAINTNPTPDEWGVWVSAFHPLFDPEGNFDGAVGIDFDYSLWSGNLTKAKIWPYASFSILMMLFFGCTYLIVLNQRSLEESERYAALLQKSVAQLTEAKRAAEAAVRAKGHFLANMSHEIRTPMNAVLGFANIIGRRLMLRCLPEERAQCGEFVDLITGSGNDLLTIINDILDFSKVESDQIDVESIPVSLRETIESIRLIMQERLAGKEGLTLEFTNEEDFPEFILSDPTRLRQILSNLIGNAIKFTESGTVVVRYGTETATTDEHRDMLFVEVRDTGIGMSPGQLNHLFQPFSQADSSSTRRFGGTGLGLSISKRLAILLGGDIRVTSTKGVGSTFTLVLPIREPCAETVRNRNEGRRPHAKFPTETTPETIGAVEMKPLANLGVLVVDDGRINQIVISTQLTEAGAKVALADNGQVAIESIEANESVGTPFDVILMDMQMPVMDGYEATRHLRCTGYARPIIAITAHALSGDCEKTLEVGCDAYLSKPVDGEQLIRTILEIIHTGRNNHPAGHPTGL